MVNMAVPLEKKEKATMLKKETEVKDVTPIGRGTTVVSKRKRMSCRPFSAP